MTTRSSFLALALATVVTAAVLAGIGQIANPGVPAQLVMQAEQALEAGHA